MADRRRRGGPDEYGGADGGSPWDDTWEGEILDIIYGHYKEALDALPLEDMPALALRLLDAGVCFGFADPVTNIIANTLCFVPVVGGKPNATDAGTSTVSFLPEEVGEPTRADSQPNSSKRKRKRNTKASGDSRVREEVFSKIVARDGPSPPGARTIAERSLVGLVSFLTSYFRHLPRRGALHYLSVARADLLVAVYLIQKDRCYHRKDDLCISSYAVKAALKCAACSARQPNSDGFLTGCFRQVSHINSIIEAACSRPLSAQDISRLFSLLKKPVKLKDKSDKPMNLAAERFCKREMDLRIENVQVEVTESLRGVVMDKIHDQYLKAVSRFPMKDFQTRLHRSFLKAGYCYGPFNPISNVIVNTIWYDTAFPPSEQFGVEMISTMRHIESRSLIGLLAFLRAYIPDMSEHGAMIHLLKSDLNIRKMIQMINLEEYDTCVGYQAATDASYHPNSEKYCEFVMQHLPTVRSRVRLLLKASQVLQLNEVISLSGLLLFPNPSSLKPIVELSEDALKMVASYKETFLAQQNAISKKIKAAMQDYNQVKGCQYDLGIICGVNNYVGKETSILEPEFEFSHVNFWATENNGKSVVLFFAEFPNDEDNNMCKPVCCPVSDLSAQVRCCYCEVHGIRIVHPIETFWEGARDFEKIASEEHKIKNSKIISYMKVIDNEMGIFVQDYIYLDPARDFQLIQDMNGTALIMNLDIDAEMRRIKATTT